MTKIIDCLSEEVTHTRLGFMLITLLEIGIGVLIGLSIAGVI